jgi:hypothetical protein
MAKQRFSGPINAARWPLLAALQGRTVIQPTYDPGAGRARRDADEIIDRTIPQIVYCENVMPTVEGIMSVGFEQVVDNVTGPDANTFDQVFVLRDAAENQYCYSPAGGQNWIALPPAPFEPLEWVQHEFVSLPPDGTAVSRAYCNGRTFVCYAGIGLFEYNGVTFDQVTLTLPVGVTDADILCVGASNNYLLISDGLTIYWSSLVDPTDFVASTSTGAGSIIPQDVKGLVIAICGTGGGFITYTTNNAVAAQYTNNIRAPFAFREIAGAGGISKNEHVTQEANSGAQYAWTTAGLQKITLQNAESIEAGVSDFIRGRKWNRWDSTTKTLILEEIGVASLVELKVKITLTVNRYLCVSYGNTQDEGRDLFKYCLVYDTLLKRWGNLKVEHVDVFTFNAANSKWEIAVVDRRGTVHAVVKRYTKLATEAGVLILGRYQLTRQNLITHQLTTVDGTYLNAGEGFGSSFAAYIANSLDGNTLEAGEEMTLASDEGGTATYDLRITGVNFNLILTGTFALSMVVLETVNDGDI